LLYSTRLGIVSSSTFASMVYTMKIYADGGCRGNGHPWAIGAAAIAFKSQTGTYYNSWTLSLPSDPPPTNQRAEITAIILALEQALERYEELNTNPWLDVTIYSDSKYVVNCMTDFIYKWTGNGWTTAAGYEVANRDLLEKASDLDDRLREEGDVTYVWIPREENEHVDTLCNEDMDDQ
jgi:ribonuclease HI